jgi:hypothetical protein
MTARFDITNRMADEALDNFCYEVARTMETFGFDLDDVREFIKDNIDNVRGFWDDGRSETATAHLLSAELMD